MISDDVVFSPIYVLIHVDPCRWISHQYVPREHAWPQAPTIRTFLGAMACYLRRGATVKGRAGLWVNMFGIDAVSWRPDAVLSCMTHSPNLREREFEGLEAVELAYCQLFSLRIIGGYWWIVSCQVPRMILRKFVLVPTPLQAMELWTRKTLREIEPWHAFPVTAPLLPKHCHDASVGLIAIGPPRFKDFQVPATPAKLE